MRPLALEDSDRGLTKAVAWLGIAGGSTVIGGHLSTTFLFWMYWGAYYGPPKLGVLGVLRRTQLCARRDWNRAGAARAIRSAPPRRAWDSGCVLDASRIFLLRRNSDDPGRGRAPRRSRPRDS